MEYFLHWIVIGIIGTLIGYSKGITLNFVILGILLGPIGWIITDSSKGNKIQCIYCKEQINPHVTDCPYCNKER